MLHALYWCYVTDARADMAPEKFQEFLGTFAPPPQPLQLQDIPTRPHLQPPSQQERDELQEVRPATIRSPKVERPTLTQPHRRQHLPAFLSPQLLRKGVTTDGQLKGNEAVDPAGPRVDATGRLLSLLTRLESEAQSLPPTSLFCPSLPPTPTLPFPPLRKTRGETSCR